MTTFPNKMNLEKSYLSFILATVQNTA